MVKGSLLVSLELGAQSRSLHVADSLRDPLLGVLRIPAALLGILSEVLGDFGSDFVRRSTFEQGFPQKSIVRVARELGFLRGAVSRSRGLECAGRGLRSVCSFQIRCFNNTGGVLEFLP